MLEEFTRHFLWLTAWFVPAGLFFFLVYLGLSMPLRRNERAQFFLDLLEINLKQGRTSEQALVGMAQTRDRDLGARFQLVAAHVENGRSLSQALQHVPAFLPPNIQAMIRVGEEIGDLRPVFPAARKLLTDAISATSSAVNYFMILAFVLLPVAPVLFLIISVFVLPKLEMLFASFEEGIEMPLHFIAGWQALCIFQLIVAAVFYIGFVAYLGGPRFIAWLQAGIGWPISDWILYQIPWKRKRLQRDFVSMLSLLLDSGVPEGKALPLAAQSTANRIFRQRAERVAAALSNGEPLSQALRKLERSPELAWRLRNAMHQPGRFCQALSGWMESLDARAFQQQQAFSQGLTTALVILNGVMVALVAAAFFHALVSIINLGVLW
ncbi:MAG: type II secretion system F family protein [Verrucomicrobiota bacterium]